MQPGELRFSAQELEQLCGMEITSHWIGSPWAGAYRRGFLRGQQLLKTLLLEGLMLGLGAIAILPLALGAMLRLGNSAIAFVQVLLTLTLVLVLLRHLRLWQNGRRWRSLLSLLEEVDRFHQLLEAAMLLRSLDALGPSAAPAAQLSPDTIQALRLTRDSLLTGLMTERLLRSHQLVLSRYQELLHRLDENGMELHRLEAARQSQSQSLQESLEISAAVQAELRSLLPPSSVSLL